MPTRVNSDAGLEVRDDGSTFQRVYFKRKEYSRSFPTKKAARAWKAKLLSDLHRCPVEITSEPRSDLWIAKLATGTGFTEFVSKDLDDVLAWRSRTQSELRLGIWVDPEVAALTLGEQFLVFQNYDLAINVEVKIHTESPAMKAMREMAGNQRKQVEIITRWARSNRGRIEMALYHKENKSEKLATFIAKVLDGFSLAQFIATFLPSLLEFTKRKSRRARLMALRGLALSCAPNLSRRSDMPFISRAIRGSHNSLVAKELCPAWAAIQAKDS